MDVPPPYETSENLKTALCPPESNVTSIPYNPGPNVGYENYPPPNVVYGNNPPPNLGYGNNPPPNVGYGNNPGYGNIPSNPPSNLVIQNVTSPNINSGNDGRPVLVFSGSGPRCGNCLTGTIKKSYTCWGICVAILCFPVGFLCCLFMTRSRCYQCGQRYN